MKAVIILSAGHGKRMKSSLPKVLHKVSGKPMLQWVLDAAKILKPEQMITVVSPELKTHDIVKNTDIVVQEVPQGTGDALKLAIQKLQPHIEKVFLLCADTPLLQAEDLERLACSQADLSLIGMKINDLSKSYGRIQCDEKGIPKTIKETKHDPDSKSIAVANSGVYAFNAEMLKFLLPQLKIHPDSNEFYATDLVELASQNKYSTALLIENEENFLGVNTLVELAQAEAVMQSRLKIKHMLNGVRFSLPETTYVNHDAEIGSGTVIEQSVRIGEFVKIGNNVTIFGFSYLSNCVINDNSTIGPFSHLRNNTIIENAASIGNFVEIKGSTIGKGAKAKHLSYIGDAEIEEKANIGAGTITCNYNGFKKFKTHVGKNTMIGANSTLIAPVSIGEGAYIAAGSVIVKDVDANSLGISRTQQQEESGWATHFREKHTKS